MIETLKVSTFVSIFLIDFLGLMAVLALATHTDALSAKENSQGHIHSP